MATASMLKTIENIEQEGAGLAATYDGQYYRVQRLLQPSPANGSISNQVPIFTAYRARIRRFTLKVAIENEVYNLLVFNAFCDTRKLKPQDVLTEWGTFSDGGVYTYVQHRVTRETLFIRTESNINITRPMPVAGKATQQPISGTVFVPGLGGIDKETEEPLSLTNGIYTFDDPVAPLASVWAGMQPVHRIGDTSRTTPAGQMPASLYRERFTIFIPLLPGVFLNELDRLNFPATGDRYEVMQLFTTMQTGISGYICVCEKLGV